MPWREEIEPVRMQRVAVVAAAPDARRVLVELADAGVVEVEHSSGGPGLADSPAEELLRRTAAEHGGPPRLSPVPPDLESLSAAGRVDLIAGEADLEACRRAALARDGVVAWAGWTPAAELGPLAERLAAVGGSVVPLPAPRGVDPPTLLQPGGELRSAFSPLVRTYGTVPYSDVDPTLMAGLAYVLMFGVMFGDAGHGALLLAGGLLLRTGRPARLARFQHLWLFVAGAGLASVASGLLYGEFFGPTGVVPVLWIAPLEEPVTLLAAALGLGGVLLGGAYAVGTVNRWREGRWPLAVIAPSGLAGVALFAGLGLVVLGAAAGVPWVLVGGAVFAVAGLVLAYVGFLAASGGGATGITQATVELFDAVIRLGTNLVSFTRLAAFGLTHAALGQVVWDGTTSLAGGGVLSLVGAVALFVAGNAVAFTLEALVAGVQALRLEYYELFSRIFAFEGTPFRPWHVPVDTGAGPAATTTSGPATHQGRNP